MDWELSTAELKSLRRIIAFLYSLAALAEQSCHRPAVVRDVLLWILHFAEAAAHDFVHGIPPANRPHDDSIFEARRLAKSLRSLATELEMQVEEALFFAGWAAVRDPHRVWRLRQRLSQIELLSPANLASGAVPMLAQACRALTKFLQSSAPPYVDTS